MVPQATIVWFVLGWSGVRVLVHSMVADVSGIRIDGMEIWPSLVWESVSWKCKKHISRRFSNLARWCETHLQSSGLNLEFAGYYRIISWTLTSIRSLSFTPYHSDRNSRRPEWTSHLQTMFESHCVKFEGHWSPVASAWPRHQLSSRIVSDGLPQGTRLRPSRNVSDGLPQGTRLRPSRNVSDGLPQGTRLRPSRIVSDGLPQGTRLRPSRNVSDGLPQGTRLGPSRNVSDDGASRPGSDEWTHSAWS